MYLRAICDVQRSVALEAGNKINNTTSNAIHVVGAVLCYYDVYSVFILKTHFVCRLFLNPEFVLIHKEIIKAVVDKLLNLLFQIPTKSNSISLI